MNLYVTRRGISAHLIEAFEQNGMDLPFDPYMAILFIDQRICPCNITLEVDDKGKIVWMCDAGEFVGIGANRIIAIEDVLRQFLFKTRQLNGR